MPYRAKHPLTQAATAVVLLSVLSACGGGGGSAPEAGSAPTAAVASASSPGPGTTPAPTQLVQRSDFPVNTSQAGDQGTASIATLAGGGFVVAWSDLATGSSAVRLQRFDAQAQPVGSELQATASGSIPSVAALVDGGFVVTWFRSPYQYEANAYAQRFDAQGAPVGGEVQLSAAFFKYVPRAMGLADGSFVLAADTTTGRYGSEHGLVARFAADGTPLGQPTRLLADLSPQTGATDPNSASGTTTALAPDGSFVAAWIARGTDVSEVRLTRFDAQAAPVGSTLPVMRATSLHAPAVAVLAGGQVAIAWVEGAHDAPKTLWLQRLDPATGNSPGRVAVATGVDAFSVQPRIAAMGNGGFVLAWNAVRLAGDSMQRELSVQRFDAQGNAAGAREDLGPVAAPLSAFGTHHDSLDAAGVGGEAFVVLHGAHSPGSGWDVRGALR